MAVKRTMVSLVLFLLSFIFIISSCGEPYLQTASANQNSKSGNLQKAVRKYLSAEKRTAYPGVPRYNLGNSYYFLGEQKQALELWAQTAESAVPEARFRGYFNRGVVSYREGAYEQAAGYFLAALEIKPDSMDAKVNLEYSVRRIEGKKGREKQQKSAAVSAEEGKAGIEPFTEELLQMISQREKKVWESKSEETGTPARDW
jgi:tetratricopeptide (TPR) repeat protein